MEAFWWAGIRPILKAWGRQVLLAGANSMIYGGIYTDLIGLVVGVALYLMQRRQAVTGENAAPKT